MVFNIDGEHWTLDLRTGSGKAYKGTPENDEKPELTLTISDENFVKLVMGKLGPQQVSLSRQMSEVHTASQGPVINCWRICLLQAFLMRKLKISGSMGLALKLQPILDAAAPKAKL